MSVTAVNIFRVVFWYFIGHSFIITRERVVLKKFKYKKLFYFLLIINLAFQNCFLQRCPELFRDHTVLLANDSIWFTHAALQYYLSMLQPLEPFYIAIEKMGNLPYVLVYCMHCVLIASVYGYFQLNFFSDWHNYYKESNGAKVFVKNANMCVFQKKTIHIRCINYIHLWLFTNLPFSDGHNNYYSTVRLMVL